MKIGITAANGFIGSHLRKRISDAIVIPGDLRELDVAQKLVVSCDRIYHLAGKNREALGDIAKNNLVCTSNIVLAMKVEKKYPEIIFASSQQVVTDPDSEYGFTKAIEEEIIKKAPRWCIFRIPNVYGPGGRPYYNSVVATFCYQIARGEPVTIHDPNVKREFIFVDDLADELLAPRFNVCRSLNGEVMSVGQLYSYLSSKPVVHEKLARCLQYYIDRVDA